jgi:N-acetylglucosaminyldiphosphoundecaprenol N-acetyl-beta-D-mannosaminyltransferase
MKFCNINFNIKNKNDLYKINNNEKIKFLIPTNAVLIVFANKSKRLFDIISKNYPTLDGAVPLIIAKICYFYKKLDMKKLSGSDIVYDFCEYAKKNNLKIFFLGGNLESNQAATKVIKEKYGISIEGFSPDFENYPFTGNFNKSCLEKINNFKPDILFVGFGAPKQEYWIDDHLENLSSFGVKYVIASGGTFDFVSKKIKRAPKLIQNIGLEGLYRFYQEPNKERLKRLIVSCLFFKYIRHKPEFL